MGKAGALVDQYTIDWLAETEGAVDLQIKVTMVSCRGLRNADELETELHPDEGGSDPYCVCEIPAKKRSSVKTPVVRNTSDPVWNYDIKVPDFAETDSLIFSVFDKDYGKADDLLGKVLLPNKEFYPNGFEGELRLDEAGHGIEAYLKVKIRFEVDQEAATSGVKLVDKARDATSNTE